MNYQSASIVSLPNEVMLNCVLCYLKKADGLRFLSLCRSFIPLLLEIRTACISDVVNHTAVDLHLFMNDAQFRQGLLDMLGCFDKSIQNKRKLRYLSKDYNTNNFLITNPNYFYCIGKVSKERSQLELFNYIALQNPTSSCVPRFVDIKFLDTSRIFNLQVSRFWLDPK